MANADNGTGHSTNNSKAIYVYDEKLGWINVTMFLDNLKKVMNMHTRSIKKDTNLIRLYYSSC
jgi:hypothetical protein